MTFAGFRTSWSLFRRYNRVAWQPRGLCSDATIGLLLMCGTVVSHAGFLIFKKSSMHVVEITLSCCVKLVSSIATSSWGVQV